MSLPTFSYNLSLLSLFLTIFLSLFFLITKKGRKSGNVIMSLLLVLFSFQIFYSFSISNFAYQYFISWHKSLFFLRQSALLMGPVIYFYVQPPAKQVTFRPQLLLHLLPFVGMELFLAIYNFNANHFIIWLTPLDLYSTLAILIVNLSYILLSFFSFSSMRFSLTRWNSNFKNSSYTSWLSLILFGFIVVWILNLNVSAIYMITQKPVWCAYSRSIYVLVVFIFLSSIMLILMLKPEIYYLQEKYKKSKPVDEEFKASCRQKLISYMDSAKPYLNPDISLETVARDLSINARVLSQIINESFKNNFNGFINEYRIRESLAQLAATNNSKTILEIIYDSGFNSKSAFYSEFKKHIGITPQEYSGKYHIQQKVLAS